MQEGAGAAPDPPIRSLRVLGRGLPLSLIFAGTSGFAVPSLRALVQAGYTVSAVITQPTRPAGRGRRYRPSPVLVEAQQLGLPVRLPPDINAPAEVAALRSLSPEVLVVAAYGQILRPPLLTLSRRGAVNLHASLLPAFRGAAPVAHALLAGETSTGVTLMRMDEGLDTGPILAQASLDIDEADDRGSLTRRLAGRGAALLVKMLPRHLSGRLPERAQDHALASLAPSLKKADGAVRWSQEARQVHYQVRAFSPWPGAFTFVGGHRLLLRRVRLLAPGEPVPHGPPGAVGDAVPGAGLPVACGAGTGLMLERVQLASRREMDALAAWRGGYLKAGDLLEPASS
ncbi:MAG: methionyl-tRNA formyltransferase [Acidobacteriota bacterium]